MYMYMYQDKYIQLIYIPVITPLTNSLSLSNIYNTKHLLSDSMYIWIQKIKRIFVYQRKGYTINCSKFSTSGTWALFLHISSSSILIVLVVPLLVLLILLGIFFLYCYG